MEGVTRRTCLTMGGASVLAGVGAYAAGDGRLWNTGATPRFAPAGSAREALQQRHLPNVPLVTHDGRELSLLTMIATFGTPLDVTVSELMIESFYPADDATAEYLRSLS